MKKKPTKGTPVSPPDPRWPGCKHKNQCIFLPFLGFCDRPQSFYRPNKKYCHRCSLFLEYNDIFIGLQFRDYVSKLKKQKSRLESNEEKLRKLIESDEYRKDFAKLKMNILARKQPLAARSATGVNNLDVRIVQDVLKNKNVNDYALEIPPTYDTFINRWGLRFFFDPAQSYSRDFSPFKEPRMNIKVKHDGYHPDRPDNFKMTIDFDVREKLETIVKNIKYAVKKYREMILEESRKERILYDDIIKTKQLLAKQLLGKGKTNKMHIFREMYPQYSWFNPKKDYQLKPKEERTTEDHDAWAALHRIDRLVQRAKIGIHT